MMDEELLIKELEEKLLLQKIRSSREEMEKLISPDFIEYGSSGKIYNYKGTLAYLLANAGGAFTYTFINFKTQRLSDDFILALYILEVEKNHKIIITNRSSLWRREEYAGHGIWRIVFHQGTRVTR
ncbi:MAG: DUF4440 domain-containing protein [Treponema sp.]|jgi:hypothetical protein|nr:DUF4440 domain-containing protein [Treponema sp.]